MIADNELRSRVPPHTIGGIDRYVEHHIEPGSFLRAVLENNLREALGRADSTNRFALFDIVTYLYNCVPHNCWGDAKRVEEWLAVREAK
jgi:hypothetical protein